MNKWNHRVIKHVTDKGETWFGIHEVHYDGNMEPTGCTENPINLTSEDLNGLRWQVSKIKLALSEPILDFKYFTRLERKAKNAKSNNKDNKDNKNNKKS